MIGFVATAYVAVITLVGYYLFAFQPGLDPFRKGNERARTPRPNPIDQLVLDALPPALRKGTNRRNHDPHRWSKLEKSFDKVRRRDRDAVLIHLVNFITVRA